MYSYIGSFRKPKEYGTALDEAKRLQEEATMSSSVLMNEKLEWVKAAEVTISVSRM